jgi:hypothetical protein
MIEDVPELPFFFLCQFWQLFEDSLMLVVIVSKRYPFLGLYPVNVGLSPLLLPGVGGISPIVVRNLRKLTFVLPTPAASHSGLRF